MQEPTSERQVQEDQATPLRVLLAAVPMGIPVEDLVPATVQVEAPATVVVALVEVAVAVVAVEVVAVAAIETESKLERHSICLWNPHHAPSGQFLLANPTHLQKF